jgi:hypothetical protein
MSLVVRDRIKINFTTLEKKSCLTRGEITSKSRQDPVHA